MNNKTAIILISTVAIAGVIVAIYLYTENVKMGVRIKDLEKDKLNLILDAIKKQKGFSNEILKQLEKLAKEFETTDPQITAEIAQALQLLQIGQIENAIEDLVKILEYLLTTYYKDDKSFKTWLKEQKKKISLHNLIVYCKEDKVINEVEYHFFIAIKTIRNKEDHTLDLKLDGYLNASGLITAVGALMKISNLCKDKKSLSPSN